MWIKKWKCKHTFPKENWKFVNCLWKHSAVWEGCKKYKEKLKEVTQTINVKSYAKVAKSDLEYMNERLGLESSYIKNKVLKVN